MKLQAFLHYLFLLITPMKILLAKLTFGFICILFDLLNQWFRKIKLLCCQVESKWTSSTEKPSQVIRMSTAMYYIHGTVKNCKKNIKICQGLKNHLSISGKVRFAFSDQILLFKSAKAISILYIIYVHI